MLRRNIAAILTLLAALAVPGAAGAAGPTLAVEDTMRTEVPEILVRAPRVTLEEILDRVRAGEARRDSAIRDQQFTATIRLVRDVGGGKPAKLQEESVWRVFRKKPDQVRAVKVREWSARKKKEDDGGDADVEFSPNSGERMVNFAFRPDASRDYRFRIAGRDLIGDHLVYRIAFEPRSALDPSPGGLVWVDTNDFVIVREELTFRGSPVPLLIKGVRRMVVERQRAGDHWVLARVMARIETTVPLPGMGNAFDFAIRYDDYRHNVGLDDALFSDEAAR
jgi:hypothetical protein